MIFNSFEFLIYFSTFFLIYWLVFKDKFQLQNIFLLLSSYAFYALADVYFLAYLIGISALNYYLAIYIEKNNKYQSWLLWIGLIQGLGSLAYFKYFNFFIQSFNDLFSAFNLNFNLQTLNIILPLGISYFTFRVISYLLDVNKGKIPATKNWLAFFNYIAFFPCILSGPIDKARDFLPQLEKERNFDYAQAVDGLRQVLWGLFKKVVVADSCAVYANNIFNNYQDYSSSTLLLGAIFYSFQLYADFSGYSDMAIGIGRLMGFKITKNFDFPFFSQNIAEFWRKWHISLTSWLTEYVFLPLSIAFRDYGKPGLILAIIINLIAVGIWHGANWTFVVFGLIHGLLFIPLILKGTFTKRKKLAKGQLLPKPREALNMLHTYIPVMLTLVLIRAENITQAYRYVASIFTSTIFTVPSINAVERIDVIICLLLILLLLSIEWVGRYGQYGIDAIGINRSRIFRLSFYFFLAITTLMFIGQKQDFIYFQF